MSVNKFVIRQDGFDDKQVNIPVELKWDYLGLDLAIEEYERNIITEVIGVGRDFEISRFAHAPATGTTNNTEINYEFYFYFQNLIKFNYLFNIYSRLSKSFAFPIIISFDSLSVNTQFCNDKNYIFYRIFLFQNIFLTYFNLFLLNYLENLSKFVIIKKDNKQ